MAADERKVFCIGFNKTGTTSLHNFFMACGLSSTHNIAWPDYSRVGFGRSYFKYQCYTDGEQSSFIALDRWFPGSLFILNDRDERKWLYSRVKHVMRFDEQIDMETLMFDQRYGKMAKEFFVDPECAIRKWICERRIYIRQVRLYFKNNPNYTELDITRDDEWTRRLVEFFRNTDYPFREPDLNSGIHRNRRSEEEFTDQDRLEKYLALVDRLVETA